MKVELLRQREDPRLFRLWDPASRTYLHLSGAGTTELVDQSWLGFSYQAENLRQLAAIRGEDWPFVRVRRNAHEIETNLKEADL